MAGLTGGASAALPGGTGEMGESFLQGFGGAVGAGGDPGFTGLDPVGDAPAKPAINPAVIVAGVAAIGAVIFFATRKK